MVDQPTNIGIALVDAGRKPPLAFRIDLLRQHTVQAVAAVMAVHLVLLVPLYGGWLNALQYGIAAALFCVAALTMIGRRLSRSLAHLHAVLRRFGVSLEQDTVFPATGSGALDALQTSLETVHRRVVRRERKLKAAFEAAERELEESRHAGDHYERAQRLARVGSWGWQRAGNAITCSHEVFRILDTAVSDAPPTPLALCNVIHGDDRRVFRRWLIKLARGSIVHGIDVKIVAGNGDIKHVHVLGEPVLDAGARVVGLAGTIQDATERTRAIQQIHRLAYFDTVTELPNRSRFHQKLAETLDIAKRDTTGFAILFLDLDHFKRINDTLGHAVGDDLLRTIAQRLTRGMRVEDIAGQGHGQPVTSSDRDVCRQGGDEFIVLLNGVATEQDAARAANRLLANLAQPILLGAQEIFVSASIGIVLYPRDGGDLDTLLKNADVAMYNAKAGGRNRFFFYQDSMRAASAQRLSLEHDLRKALEGEQFELYYQPQIEVRSGKVVGIEALIRWNHPTLGMLGPAHFITAAEEAGLIMAIWEWVLVTALIQHNAWIQEGLPPVTIGVNLSSVQFSDPSLADHVQEIARVIGIPLDYLELEVTESMLMLDFEAAMKTLTALRRMGVKIAIDDFGTGYSSLSYLRHLPLDKLKLDQSFTRGAGENEGDVAITRAVIAMAQSLNLSVVAEGVETQAQIDFLLDLGCTTVQGFLLGRPLPSDATARLLRESVDSQGAPAADAADVAWNAIVGSGTATPEVRSSALQLAG